MELLSAREHKTESARPGFCSIDAQVRDLGETRDGQRKQPLVFMKNLMLRRLLSDHGLTRGSATDLQPVDQNPKVIHRTDGRTQPSTQNCTAEDMDWKPLNSTGSTNGTCERLKFLKVGSGRRASQPEKIFASCRKPGDNPINRENSPSASAAYRKEKNRKYWNMEFPHVAEYA